MFSTLACVERYKSLVAVYKRTTFLQLTLLPLGIALLLAGLFFQLGSAETLAQEATPVATQDRLAEPTLPAAPLQADYGAQVYWLNCSPCHGDRAQGLTDEFRELYPEEDRNCWNSHCHGDVTYENGFTIPTTVPALIGADTLAKFPTAANLYGYIHATMPFQNPGVLTDEEYYQIVAFLLRQNGTIDGGMEVNETNAAQIVVSHATPVLTPQATGQSNEASSLGAMILLGSLLVLILVLFVLKKFQNTTTI
jgi:mono/diheme cytochrome c family protein